MNDHTFARRPAAVVLAVVLAAWGCVGEHSSHDDGDPDTSHTAVVRVGAQAEDEDLGPSADDPRRVTVRAVTVGPYEGMPDTLPAGEVTFVFENQDAGESRAPHGPRHDLRIEELDVGTRILPGGASDEFTVDLAPGTYTFYCRVGDHRDRGMEGRFEVVEEVLPGRIDAGTGGLLPSARPAGLLAIVLAGLLLLAVSARPRRSA